MKYINIVNTDTDEVEYQYKIDNELNTNTIVELLTIIGKNHEYRLEFSNTEEKCLNKIFWGF